MAGRRRVLVLMTPSPTRQRVRVIDLETAGNAATDVCEIGWQDVVFGDDGRWHLGEERGALFVNPARPITPETMAVHHILDREVADAPFWKQVAPEVLKPDGGVLALAAHRAAFEQRFCTPQLSGGTKWTRAVDPAGPVAVALDLIVLLATSNSDLPRYSRRLLTTARPQKLTVGWRPQAGHGFAILSVNKRAGALAEIMKAI
jgi:hypothetical protein